MMITVLSGPKLAAAARLLIVLYLPFAFSLAVYYLGFRRDTWTPSPDDGSVPDTTRYSRATKRSSAVYLAINLILLAGAKVLGISYSSVGYNFVSLFVSTMITYIYDRAVSTDDGLTHLKESPGMTIYDAYLSICSPSYMRYLIVLAAEISLSIIIAYHFGALIPSQCWIASSVFRKSIVPVVVYSIIGGPLRFAWAYPTVSEAGRVPYLTAYMITFTILGVVTYASGKVVASAAAGILILMALIAMILQSGGFSNAQRTSDVVLDATVMPAWLMTIFASIILISSLVIGYRIFASYLHPYLITTSSAAIKTKVSKNHRVRVR